VNVFERIWSRLRGKEPDPTIGTQIGLVAGAVAVNEAAHGSETPDYGWSGDHVSGSDLGGGGGGFDGGGGGDPGGGGF
jgi:hypothetical protein